MHRHTSMHVGMIDCIRSDSESELGNQLSGILRKASKPTCILVYLNVCTSRTRMCAGTISLIPPLCLFVCRCTP